MDTEHRTPLKQIHENCPDSARKTASTYKKLISKSPWREVSGNDCYEENKIFGLSEINNIVKITHLDSERKEIEFQIAVREEIERQHKQQISNLEGQLLSLEHNNSELGHELRVSKEDNLKVQLERDTLANEIRKLTKSNLIENQNSSSTWSQMTAASRELKRAEQEANQFKRECTILQEQNANLMRQLGSHAEKERNISQELQVERDCKRKLMEQLELSAKEVSKLNLLISSNNSAYETYKENADEENLRLQNEICDLRILIQEMEDKAIELSKNEMKPINNVVAIDENVHSCLQSSYYQMQQSYDELSSKLQQNEIKRKKLHNQLQELKGNIRVYVRCRPFLPSDGGHGSNRAKGSVITESAESCLSCNADGTTITLADTCTRGSGSVFVYDGVFSSNSTQQDIFDEVGDFIQSVLDGYNICILSYGQTGSGKTHTMTGDTGSNDMKGIIPRAIELILNSIKDMKKLGWSVSLTCSMLEVYNESIIDLLSNNANDIDDNKLKISMNNDRVVVNHLTSYDIPCDNVAEGVTKLDHILTVAAKSRTTACTAMNERSSRSHLLFLLNIKAVHTDGTTLQGSLKLVDLAGSERLDRTGTLTDSARLKETVNINKSLSCLGEVFLALANKSSHIPFRNSKLTMLLQDCLSGDGKTMMLVSVSPTLASSHETLCSLRFANQISNVHLGAARKNITINRNIQSAPSSIYSSTSSFSMPQANGMNDAIQPLPSTLPTNARSSSRSRQSILPAANSQRGIQPLVERSTEYFTQVDAEMPTRATHASSTNTQSFCPPPNSTFTSNYNSLGLSNSSMSVGNSDYQFAIGSKSNANTNAKRVSRQSILPSSSSQGGGASSRCVDRQLETIEESKEITNHQPDFKSFRLNGGKRSHLSTTLSATGGYEITPQVPFTSSTTKRAKLSSFSRSIIPSSTSAANNNHTSFVSNASFVAGTSSTWR